MTPLRVCGFLALGTLTLLFVILCVIAMLRVLRAPVQSCTTYQQDIPIDVLVLEKDIELNTKSISMQQSVLLVPGMNILVYQQTEQDGLYLIDRTNEMIRFDCVKKDIIYPVDIGIHRGLRFQASHSLEKERVLRHIIHSPIESISVDDDVAQLILFLDKAAKHVELRTTSKVHCLMTVINECKSEASILVVQDGQVEKDVSQSIRHPIVTGIHFYSLQDNSLMAVG